MRINTMISKDQILSFFSPFARASSKFPFVMTIGLSITECSDKENWFDEGKQD